MQKPGIPKGTRDFNPEKSRKRAFLIETISRQFRKYGFNKIETPTLENLSVLTGKYGEEGDQLLFKVLNSGDYLKNASESDYHDAKALLPKIAEKGLRYDLTVPFARYVAMNQNDIAFPFKRYQIQPVWRADRPQKGRYREFVQCDADIIGSNSKWLEVELSLLVDDVFRSLGLQEYVLWVNHREILFGLAEWLGLKGKEIPFCAIIDKLDKIGAEKVMEELATLELNENASHFQSLLENRNEDTEAQLKALQKILGDNDGIKFLIYYFQKIQQTGKNLKVSLDWTLARGLSYYTGLIYEAKATTVKMGSILGGGRYDNLTGMFGLPGVSGVGISFGIDRIYDVMEELQLFPPETKPDLSILIVHFDERGFEHGLGLLQALREQDIAADIYPEPAKFKKQMTYANRLKVPYTITIGDNEIESGHYPLKDMESGTTELLDTSSLFKALKSKH